MKYLKSLLTMLVIVAMAVSSISVFAAGETASTTFSDITPGTKEADAVAKLVAYKVITGYEDGTFKPEGQITRAEFAAVITRFKGIADSAAADAVTGFSDLDNDGSRAWARPYVKAAADAGIINGFEDGTFRAAEPVTYEQAVKMLICAIGYEPVAQSEYNKLLSLGTAGLTWSSGYISAANKNGLTANAIVGVVTEPATRGTVAILTSNAYEVPKLNTTTDSSGNTIYEKDENTTVGGDQYNTQEKIEGTVVATCYTSLENPDSQLDMNELVIKDKYGDDATYEMSEALAASINLDDILGKKVTGYYSKDEQAISTLSAAENSIVEIEEHEISNDLSGNVILYVEDGRNKNVSVAGYSFIYNGKAGYIDSLSELAPLFRNGTIEVNETTKVVKINSYEVFVVNSYSKTEGNGKIYLKYRTYNGETFYEFPSGGTSTKPEIYVNGAKKEFDSLTLSQYNVINYLESPNVGGRKIRKMYVTTGAKSGKVTAVHDADRLVEIGNTEYYLTNDYNEYVPGTDAKAPFEMNDSYSFYLDYTGQIAAIKYSAASAGSYEIGYVTAVEDGNGVSSSGNQIKLIKKDGKAQVYTMKDKLKVDGATVNSSDVKGILTNIAENELSASLEQTGIAQPIKFSVSGGEISAIDTVRTGEGGNNDSFAVNALRTSNSLPKPGKTSVSMNNTTYQLSASTIVLYVPDDRSQDVLYSKSAPSTAFAVSESRRIEIFGADADGLVKTAGIVLVYGLDPTLTLTGNSPIMIVERTYNGNTIEGYKIGEKELSEVIVSEDRFNVSAEKAWVSFDEIEKGDVIRYLTSGGEVVATELLYDANAGENKLNTNAPDVKTGGLTFEDTDGSDLYIFFAEAYEIKPDESLIYITTEFGDGDKQADGKFSSTSVNSSTSYYKVNGSNIEVAEDMKSIKDATTDNPSKLVIVKPGAKTSAAKAIYILN